jgi:hypothetical protein
MKLRTFVEVRDGASSTVRTPTRDEIKNANRRRDQVDKARVALTMAQARLTKLIKACPHDVSVDAPGMEYDHRTCYSCGKDQGLV